VYDARSASSIVFMIIRGVIPILSASPLSVICCSFARRPAAVVPRSDVGSIVTVYGGARFTSDHLIFSTLPRRA